MGAQTNIPWTDATWPIVQGCSIESPGCSHCYAVPLLWRLAHNPLAKVSGPLHGLVKKAPNGALHFTGRVELRYDRLRDPIRWQMPRRIFVPSHGDLFHENVPDEFLFRVFAVMAFASRHKFQVLTKRAERMREFVHNLSKSINPLQEAARDMGFSFWFDGRALLPWPIRNIWLGVSVEDQTRAQQRIPHLLATPAEVRFLSVEPLLGPVQLDRLYREGTSQTFVDNPLTGFVSNGCGGTNGPKLDWVIVGGESGQKARPFDLAWARSIAAQCKEAKTAFFMKQMGADAFDSSAPGYAHATGHPRLHFSDRKGEDMNEWPAELRIRQFPA